MKHLLSRSIAILSIVLIVSCTKDDPRINPYFAEVYPLILEGIEIECIPDTTSNFVYAEINGMDFCHYESKVGRFRLYDTSKFTTPSPTFSSGEFDSNARHGASLDLGNAHLKNRHEVIEIEFPDFELGRDFVEYLDSIFAIEEHNIIGAEDIIVPKDFDIVQEGFLKSGGGYLKDFLIQINAIDKKNGPDNGGIGFSIKSIFGNQDGSYIRFTNVEKIEEKDLVYYDLEIDFSCNLYHWPQYGYEGLWGELRNGKIFARVSVER